MFVNCLFKKRILLCCDVMDFSNIQDGGRLVSLSSFVHYFNISETRQVIKSFYNNLSLFYLYLTSFDKRTYQNRARKVWDKVAKFIVLRPVQNGLRYPDKITDQCLYSKISIVLELGNAIISYVFHFASLMHILEHIFGKNCSKFWFLFKMRQGWGISSGSTFLRIFQPGTSSID